MPHSIYPSTSRKSRVSPLKTVALLSALAPALWLAIEAGQGLLGARPLNEAIHQSGLWSLWLLAVTLAVTPLRRATRWSRLISIRRIVGLSALAYALLHVILYAWVQHFDAPHIASEIFARFYLTIGFMALCLLCALGATSTDAMIARLGAQRWSRLHKLVYAAAIASAIHYFMQAKLDVSQPIAMAGIFALLLGCRVATWRLGDLSAGAVATVGAFAAVGTAIGEAVWFKISTGASLPLVLAANFDFSYAVRPCWFVAGAAFLLWIARLARPLIVGGGASSGREKVVDARLNSNQAAALRLKI